MDGAAIAVARRLQEHRLQQLVARFLSEGFHEQLVDARLDAQEREDALRQQFHVVGIKPVADEYNF